MTCLNGRGGCSTITRLNIRSTTSPATTATIPLRKLEILNTDTVVREAGDHLQVGDNFFCCTTPKIIPPEVDPLQTNTPSLSQANRMKRISQSGKLDMDAIYSILEREKPNQREQIKIYCQYT